MLSKYSVYYSPSSSYNNCWRFFANNWLKNWLRPSLQIHSFLKTMINLWWSEDILTGNERRDQALYQNSFMVVDFVVFTIFLKVMKKHSFASKACNNFSEDFCEDFHFGRLQGGRNHPSIPASFEADCVWNFSWFFFSRVSNRSTKSTKSIKGSYLEGS